jgi:hypothetical protein
MEYLSGCFLRIKKHNKKVKVWLMFLLVVPYLIVCFIRDLAGWTFNQTDKLIYWFEEVIKRKT